ncbi:MAG: hypothetical protein JWM74_327 [Myxococcaceae bacterium]|nr:hypothetical protein [Myxococcaceae bacterium]
MRRAAAALVAIALVACDRSSSTPPAPSAAATTPVASASPAIAPSTSVAIANDAGPDAATRASAEAFADARPLKGKSIGHTSVVFKVGFEGGLDAAYKPRSRRGKDRYKGEIAAYRLARALGLSNVPPALPRSFELKKLRDAFASNPAAVELLDKEAVADPDGTLPGALIPWIPKLDFVPLESTEWRGRWQAWLKTGGVIPDEERALAAQISTMIVFDWLTGNWDRWSGANIGIDRATNTLLYVDNDGAFFDPAPPQPLGDQLALLKKVERFSARFTGALAKLDALALATAIGEEKPGAPLLSNKVLHAIEQRRRIAVDHMQKVARSDAGSGFD